MADLGDKRVAILVDNYFEEKEFAGPLKALQDAGAHVDIVATSSSPIQGMNYAQQSAKTYTADRIIDDVRADEYDALVLPGGIMNTDTLRTNLEAKIWIKNCLNRGKIVAAICHAPLLLVSSGLARGRRLTSYFTIQDDLTNAGALWIDQDVVIDRNLITGRNPNDVKAFSQAITTLLQTV